MPRRPLSKEFKRALAGLPAREKNRLLYRLLAQHPDLAKKLEFKLLEEGGAILKRRAELRADIERQGAELFHRFYSPAGLVKEFRGISSQISAHVKTTRDKAGQIELTLAMFNAVLPNLVEELSAPIPNYTTSLGKYIITRTLKLLRLLNTFDLERRLEFQEQLMTLGEVIYEVAPLRNQATDLGLDVNWLLSGQWPAEI